MKKIIQQGAEAIIQLEDNLVTKKRISKNYRIKEIDEKIRKLRTRSETKLLEKASTLVPVPKIIKTSEKEKEIVMEFIKGKKLSEDLDKLSIKKQKGVMEEIGRSVSDMHKKGIIHGDLTTSNMVLNENGNRVYFIDFGLGFSSYKLEDKAVDIHLLKQALESRHFKNWKALFENFLKGYKKDYEDSKKILERLKAVEKRGRYKH